jgi:DeoR family transcriptional regulator, fructose operon transcriptional repressor
MFVIERVRIIKGILLDKKHINVSSLSKMLNVSEVTIRRDLEKLEEENFLMRTHGGAILIDQEEENSFSGNPDDPFFQERMEISEIAIHMIEENDIIILSSGPTNLCIAKKILSKNNITVLTNDLNIAAELSANAHIKIILIGGDLNSKNMTLAGKLAEENVKRFFVKKAFIEVEGVNMERGLTVQSIEMASLMQEITKITNQNIIVCLHKAFNNISLYQIGPIGIANKLVTTNKIPDIYKQTLFENNIQLFTAFEKYEGGL